MVVSSCAVLFSVGNATTAAGMAELTQALSAIGFGPLNAYALMTFSLLYVPCAATLATIKKESESWAWTGLTAAFQIAVAWAVTFVVYHVGALFL